MPDRPRQLPNASSLGTRWKCHVRSLLEVPCAVSKTFTYLLPCRKANEPNKSSNISNSNWEMFEVGYSRKNDDFHTCRIVRTNTLLQCKKPPKSKPRLFRPFMKVRYTRFLRGPGRGRRSLRRWKKNRAGKDGCVFISRGRLHGVQELLAHASAHSLQNHQLKIVESCAWNAFSTTCSGDQSVEHVFTG